MPQEPSPRDLADTAPDPTGPEAALAAERSLLRTLIDTLPDYVYAKDAQSRFMLANESVCRVMGTTPEDVVGKTDFDFFPEAVAAQYYADEQAVMRSGQPLINKEEPVPDREGRERWILTTKIPLRDGEGKVVGLIGVGRDITELREAEAARERLTEELAARATQLQTAAEVSRAASSILETEELLRQSVALIRERFGLYYVGIFLLDESGRQAVLRAGTGEAGRQMMATGHKLEVGGTSMIGWCIANRQARIALDVGQDAVRFENPFLPKTRSEMALPLISRGQPIGAMTIQSTQEAAFSQEDITVLQTMADQLANAIANARLLDTLAQERGLLRTLIDNIPDYVFFKDRQSRILINNKAHAVTLFGAPSPEEVVGKTDFDFFPRELAEQYYADEQGLMARGEALVDIEERSVKPDGSETWHLTTKIPLRDSEGKVVGLVGIARDITERKRVEQERERLLEQVQEHARREERLNAIAARLQEHTDIAALLQIAVEELGEALGARVGRVRLSVPEQEGQGNGGPSAGA